jgi:hypothetical protein
MNEECAACVCGLDHCHGSLVAHVDGDVECTEPDCPDTDDIRHDMVIDCAGTLPGCCAPARPRIVPLAS